MDKKKERKTENKENRPDELKIHNAIACVPFYGLFLWFILDNQ